VRIGRSRFEVEGRDGFSVRPSPSPIFFGRDGKIQALTFPNKERCDADKVAARVEQPTSRGIW
jgi:hypothetical protein